MIDRTYHILPEHIDVLWLEALSQDPLTPSDVSIVLPARFDVLFKQRKALQPRGP